MDDNSNKKTIEAYENHMAEYIAAEPLAMNDGLKAVIDKSLHMIKTDGQILEIGSGPGRDAVYMESFGFKVDRTDAAKSFVAYMRGQGHKAEILNILTDEIKGRYDMVFADAVLVHFTPDQSRLVLGKVKKAMNKNGIFTFGVKVGEGEKWSDAKVGAARYFYYWQETPLKKFLEEAGYQIKYFEKSKSRNSQWYQVICQPA